MASRMPAQSNGRRSAAGTGAAPGRAGAYDGVVRAGLTRSLVVMGGAGLMALALFLLLALLTHSDADASLTTAAGGVSANWMGWPGAWVASALLFAVGWPALLLALMVARRAWTMVWGSDAAPRRRLWLGGCIAIVLLAIAGAIWEDTADRELIAGWGGFVGFTAERPFASLIAGLSAQQEGLAKLGAALLFGITGLWLGWRSLDMAGVPLMIPSFARRRRAAQQADSDAWDDDWDDDDAGEAAPRRAVTPAEPVAAPRAAVASVPRAGPDIIESSRTAPPPKAKKSTMQSDLFADKSLPPLGLLTPAPDSRPQTVDRGALDNNARLLETVLLDFQVKGEIKAVRQGPVVTMYELEPAPGTKASRVSNLAEDIARNMSAMSARIAPIPGRTVIGIELPNARTEPVVLHELVASDAFQGMGGELPIVLGKNIAGDPVIVDLAPMPHLLIAGTTGSGKSVGLNAMILSLLYRLTPDQCRLIMIDPKMLELSMYDGIPHLLSPVVTDPQKAVRALKWAVEQMEDRYRMMSSLSVRNLAGYNDKVRGAKARGQDLRRRVQTGFDPDSGQPIYEEEELAYEPLPQIVVVVDELADLMMTAGKEVEFLIQRLAQKARAAGIHLILATQRPSVDVITGVIKANLPTRISFHVTSKIDSRTILGEQGAEQLLGKGDMLFMSGGKQPRRVHGPFVSDDEVRAVADHWRAQGNPAYIEAVTEEPEGGSFALHGVSLGEDSAEERQYAQAVQIVINSQRASTSSVQRALRIGYNTASRHIDRMEQDGIISPPNHIGRRDVLVDRGGQPPT